MPRRRERLIHRGDVWDAEILGAGRHPVVVVTRESAIEVVSSVVCILVTSSFHGHVAEIELGRAEGLAHDSAANCDNIFTLPKIVLTKQRGCLGPEKLHFLDSALGIALGLA